MKTILSVALLVSTVVCSQAQQQPPWLPIENTNSIPTNAIFSRADLLTAEATGSFVHRHRTGSVSATAYFDLHWFIANQPNALAYGTLDFNVATDAAVSPTATFHIYGPTGKHRQFGHLLTLEPLTTVDLDDHQIRDLRAGKWWFVVMNTGARPGVLVGQITLARPDGP
jgi:hypothetical protein